MDLAPLIEFNPDIMMGKPVIKGTRITVELILERIAEGYSFEDLIVAHPRLTPESIRAAFHFAAASLRLDSYYPIAS